MRLISCILGLVLSVNAFADQALLDAARRVAGEAGRLEYLTSDFVQGTINKAELERQVTIVDGLLRQYQARLGQLGGGGANLPACIQTLRNQGYDRTEAANICQSAGPYQLEVGICTQTLRNQGYDRNEAADVCVRSGAYSSSVATCTQGLRNQGYDRSEAARYCVAAEGFGGSFITCTQALRNQGYDRNEAATYCTQARYNSEFTACVLRLRNQGYDRTEAARTCAG